MDHKAWLWRRRTSPKTIVVKEKPEISLNLNENEMVPNEKEVALEESVKKLNEKLASVIEECNAKDEHLANYEKMTQEANEGREKAEAEIQSLKQELEESSHQRESTNERLIHLNAALKDYMQQLNSARSDQEQRIHSAVTNTSKEFEKSHRKLEEKLTETTRRITSLTLENSQINQILLSKENLIDDLSKRLYQTEAEFNMLMARLDSTEKENTFLKYEFRMLENEIEFSRKNRDALQVQNSGFVKKISKLESECQRLRVLVRKRFPDLQGKKIHEGKTVFLIEENRALKEVLAKREDELHCSREIIAQTDLKLSQFEIQIKDLMKSQKPISDPLLLTSSGYDHHSNDGVSDMCLMDDFVEMEKLAIVAVDSSKENDFLSEKNDDWLHDVLKAIMEETRVSKRGFDELMEEIRVNLNCLDRESAIDAHGGASSLPTITGYITWKSSNSIEEETNSGNIELENEDLKGKFDNLQNELEIVKEAKRVVEEQFENQKSMNEDLDTQMTVANVRLNEANQKLSSMEVELEDKKRCCEELETTCLELQLQLESITDRENSKGNTDQEDKQLQNEWEINAASAKLAECQDTILKLGKQLKAMASPNETAAAAAKKLSHHRSSLRDQMLAEDDGGEAEDCSSPQDQKAIIITTTSVEAKNPPNSDMSIYIPESYHESKTAAVGALAIVPNKKPKRKIALLRKLLFGKKKTGSKKPVLTFAA